MQNGELESNIVTWSENSTPRINRGLQLMADYECRAMGYPSRFIGRGWERVKGRELFTAKAYCEEVTGAYLVTLPIKFPEIQSAKPVFFQPGRGGLYHCVAEVETKDQKLLIDGTSGQQFGQENRVLAGSWDDLIRRYDPKMLTGIDFERFSEEAKRAGYQFSFVNRRLMRADTYYPADMGENFDMATDDGTINTFDFITAMLLDDGEIYMSEIIGRT